MCILKHFQKVKDLVACFVFRVTHVYCTVYVVIPLAGVSDRYWFGVFTDLPVSFNIKLITEVAVISAMISEDCLLMISSEVSLSTTSISPIVLDLCTYMMSDRSRQ